ncbi:MAG: tRNA (adenosine(37)-N6)-dimethylallyltransferase MiaA [Acidobacteria bacterium]|nr:tRNA (adenosine(37)-N6)-dimethylallyltransferase MiaA [Acidobacteriota bacterium]
MAVATGQRDVEIVAVDAMQVYRGMDIGTAKPSEHDQQMVRHHGIDLVEPSAIFTVAEFQQMANHALAGIGARGGTALLVAGTGLYLSALVNELDLPGSWPEVRERLEREAAQPDGVAMLYARLCELDQAAAQRMEPANARRIVRALEVCEGSGRPFSSYGPGLETYPDSEIVQIGIRWSRERLAERIAARVQRMMERGLLEEVRGLLDSSPLSRTAAQALGYKELIDHLEGRCSIDEAVNTIITRTRQFAVRQDRWFRRDPRIRWVDIKDDPLEAVPIVEREVVR